MAAAIAVVGEDFSDPHNLLFGVQRSVIYHNRRRQYFDGLSHLGDILSVLSGSGTIISVLANLGPWAITSCAVTVVTISTVNLIIQSSQQARLHSDLAKRFIALEKEIITAKNLTKDDLNALRAKRLDIEAEEPPKKYVLDSICHNDWLRKEGYGEEHFMRITLFQRLTCHFIDFREETIRSAYGGDNEISEQSKL